MNREELEEYMNAYGKDLYSFCCFLTQKRQEADDLYQDTFLKLYESKENLLLHNPKSYLMSVAVNLYRNQKRKLTIRQCIVGVEISIQEEADIIASDECLIEDRIVRKETLELTRGVIKELPDKYRIPILLFYMEELSLADISAILKLPEGTVKSRIHRAKKILKQKLVEVLYEK